MRAHRTRGGCAEELTGGEFPIRNTEIRIMKMQPRVWEDKTSHLRGPCFALSCVQSCQLDHEGTVRRVKNQCNNMAHYVMKWGSAQIVCASSRCLPTGSPVIGRKDKRLTPGVDAAPPLWHHTGGRCDLLKIESHPLNGLSRSFRCCRQTLTTILAFAGTVNPRRAAKSVHSSARSPLHYIFRTA